jgi:hypothetical protein
MCNISHTNNLFILGLERFLKSKSLNSSSLKASKALPTPIRFSMTQPPAFKISLRPNTQESPGACPVFPPAMQLQPLKTNSSPRKREKFTVLLENKNWEINK